MVLVHTDPMGPITPAARRGHTYVSKFTDDYSPMNEAFFLKVKTGTVDSLNLYNMTVFVSLGLRIQRLRCDEGSEYIPKGAQDSLSQLRRQCGIHRDRCAPTARGVTAR